MLFLKSKHQLFIPFCFQDTWLYHLLVASGGGSSDTGTEYERLISKLMDVEGEPGSPFWKHAQLCYSKESIDRPLTTLPSEPLKMEAVKLNKVSIYPIQPKLPSGQFQRQNLKV